jgi:1-acyl-sn-glycerol-3-phosphate acyltransferase
MSAGNGFLYAAGKSLFACAFRTIWRARVSGRHNVPVTGGVILAANHVSLADPPLVGCFAPRPIHYLAKEELFRPPGFGWLIRQVNAIPLKRGAGDVGALRTAQKILKAGGAVILFPEGTRQKSGRFGPARPGVGLLAALAKVPVVPVYVGGSQGLRRLARLQVAYGQPLPPPEGRDHQAYAERVMDAIKKLKEEIHGPPN